jgi:glycosyltransferase involved in cell wall biosynthesis
MRHPKHLRVRNRRSPGQHNSLLEGRKVRLRGLRSAGSVRGNLHLDPIHPMPFVSAIIPTYNRLPLLLEAVESVRAQTFADWELIVADDGSTDGSAEAVEALGDPRIRVVRLAHEGDEGIARNAGAAAARGEWLAFLDSDDVWTPDKLEVQLAATLRAGVGWSYAGVEMMDEEGRTVPFRSGGNRTVSGRIVREVLTFEATPFIVTLMVTRALFDRVGGFTERLLPRADQDFALRLAESAEALGLPHALARVREHPGRITRSIESPHEKSTRVYALFLARTSDPELRRVAEAQIALLRAQAAALEARNSTQARAPEPGAAAGLGE